MDIQKTGQLIASKRKEKNMTQRALAEKLGVTDKAVSKWERGLSYPDITLVVPLSELLEVSASELISGEGETEITDKVVTGAIAYTRGWMRQRGKLIFWLLSLLMLSGVLACVIVDIALGTAFSWSLYVIGGVALCWCTAAVVLYSQRGKILRGTAVGAVLTAGYLCLIQWLTGTEGWFLSLALPCIALLLPLIFITVKWTVPTFRKNIFYACAQLAFFYALLYASAVRWLSDRYVAGLGLSHGGEWLNNAINVASAIGLTLALLVIGKMRSGKKEK